MLKEIKSKIESVKYSSIDLGFGVSFSPYETLKRIYFYKNSKHFSGEKDNITRKKKPFPNISRFRARIVAKMLDLDVKDLRVVSEKDADFMTQLKAFILEQRIKQWAKKMVLVFY